MTATAVAAAPRRSWRPRLWRAAPLLALLSAALVVAVIAAIAAPASDGGLPLDPAGTGEDGTRALVEVLNELGQQVDVVGPDDTIDAPVVLVLFDQFTADERAALQRRIRAGATVVVVDPGSQLAPALGGQLEFLQPTLERSCDVAALRDVRVIRPGGGAAFEVPSGGTGCFLSDAGAWLVLRPRGEGRIVALGSGAFLTNSALRQADNAILAVHLLTPRGADRVAIVRPALRTGDGAPRTLLDLIGPGVRALLVQVLIGFLVVVAWRARRLGRPLVEHLPVTLASADLTSAVGALLARNQARAATLARVGADSRARLARRLGLPTTVELLVLATRIAERTALDRDTVLRRLDPPAPVSDAALLAATTALADLESAVTAALSSTTGVEARDLEELDVG